jgi:murein DD-endopeptidase MepM/ murein hydrolase activator NlpD
VASGQTLIKTWSINNCGTQQWPEPTVLVFLRGHRELIPGAQEEFPVQAAKPNETVEVSAVITTPAAPGRYTAFFRLADSERNMFGPRMWVDLIIPGESVQVDAGKSPKVTAKDLKAAKEEARDLKAAAKEEARAEKEEAKTLKVVAKEETKALKVAVKELKKELKQVAKDAKLAFKEAKKEIKRVGQTSDASTEPTDNDEAKEINPEIAEGQAPAEEAEVPAEGQAREVVETPSAVAPPAVKKFVSKWPIQMTALQNMGFENVELNEELLDKEKGNVQTVCNWLLERMR